METEDQSPVQDEYIPEKLDPSPNQDEYAPVIFSQETVSHIISVDMMSGKVNLHSCSFINMHPIKMNMNMLYSLRKLYLTSYLLIWCLGR